MTDTDAGKRLSDAELAGIIARNNTEKNYRAAINERIYGADADVAKLLSHIAAITANRGSVSEDIHKLDNLLLRYWEDEDFDECDPETMEDFDTPEKMLAYVTKELRRIAAIQQAVSECSGGARCEAGRIVFTLNEYRMANLVDALSQVPNNGDWWGETLNAISDGMKTINLHTLHSNGGRTFTQEQVKDHNISAPPLPPSPVKPGGAKVLQGLRDAIDGNFARVTIDGQVWERVSPVKESRDAQKPVCGTYHSRAIGVACSNCGHLKEEHQGGEGK